MVPSGWLCLLFGIIIGDLRWITDIFSFSNRQKWTSFILTEFRSASPFSVLHSPYGVLQYCSMLLHLSSQYCNSAFLLTHFQFCSLKSHVIQYLKEKKVDNWSQYSGTTLLGQRGSVNLQDSFIEVADLADFFTCTVFSICFKWAPAEKNWIKNVTTTCWENVLPPKLF